MSTDPFERDQLRRMIAASEEPLQEALRRIQEHSASGLLKQLKDSSALHAIAANERLEMNRLRESLVEAQTSFSALARSSQWAEFSEAISNAHRLSMSPETIESVRLLNEKFKILLTSTAAAIIPLSKQLEAFSSAAAEAVRPLQEQFDRTESWQKLLAKKMAELHVPWALEGHLAVSVVGFARVARLHEMAVGPDPFQPAVGETFQEELGDPVEFIPNSSEEKRDSDRIDAGLNAELLAFPQESYSHVLFSAGFDLRIEAVAPPASDRGDTSGKYDSTHASLLGQLENRLRILIAGELSRTYGPSWEQSRINGGIRRKWQERKQKDHDQRGDSYSLIFYADFMDLCDIIIEGKNWQEVFASFFRSKTDFQVSMQRISPVRNTIGHNRPLVRSDQITLFAEAYRILNSLGVRL